jgi:hypothetical protein
MKIYKKIVSDGGITKSLFRMATSLEIDYKHSWNSLQKLEKIGLVNVYRRPGCPLIISLVVPECADELRRMSAPEGLSTDYPKAVWPKS